MTKKLTLFLPVFLISLSLSAQFKSTYNPIKPQLEQVINEFPASFSGIKGEKDAGEPNTIRYKSTVQIKGALETSITGYPSKNQTHWLWESKLFVTEDLAVLKRQYKAYYNELAAKQVIITKDKKHQLVAVTEYSSPSEELRLWTNQFRKEDEKGEFKNMVVDLVAEYINFEWTIYVRVYDREKDEEIRPTRETKVY
jgi:hypothetical protein